MTWMVSGLRLIRRYLQAGLMTGGMETARS
ncbi:hypothetical protein PMI09_06067, partial [Rhizobium sp. CF122]